MVKENVTFVCLHPELATPRDMGHCECYLHGNVMVFLWQKILLFLFHGRPLERCIDQNSL